MLRLALFAFGMVSASFVSIAQAGSVNCSNASGDVVYSAAGPDGGPMGERDVFWTINGKKLIQESSLEIVAPGGAGFERPQQREVNSELNQLQVLSKSKKLGYELSTFLGYARVYTFPANNLIFEDHMICLSSQYNGVRRP